MKFIKIRKQNIPKIKQKEVVESIGIDDPECDIKNDKLHRENFVKRLISLLRDKHDKKIIGLYSKWGEGKTTVIKFIKQLINERKYKRGRFYQNSFEIIEFNLWQFDNKFAAITEFYHALSNVMGARGHKMQEIAESILGSISVGVGGAVGGISISAKELSKIFKKKETLSGLIESLKRNSATSEKRILVIMDDLDRLDKEEILFAFKIIKVYGNLPNVSYILALDPVIVRDKLRDQYGDIDFLDKFIQIEMPLPEISAADLATILQERISKEILEDRYYKEVEFDKDDQERLYDNLKYNGDFLRNIRDIKRLMIGLQKPREILLEVNPTDVIFLDLLRIRNFKLWEDVKNYPEYYIKGSVLFLRLLDEKEDSEQRIGHFKKLKEDNTLDLTGAKLLYLLFPIARVALTKALSSPGFIPGLLHKLEKNQIYEKMSVGYSDYLTKYFFDRTLENQVKHSEAKKIVKRILRGRNLKEYYSKYTKNKDLELSFVANLRHPRVLKLIDSTKKAAVTLNNVLDNFELFDSEYAPFLSSAQNIALKLCCDLVNEFSQSKEVNDVLQEFVEKGNIENVAGLLRWLQEIKTGGRGWWNLEKKDIKFLQDKYNQRIEKIFRNNLSVIFDLKYWVRVLFAWSDTDIRSELLLKVFKKDYRYTVELLKSCIIKFESGNSTDFSKIIKLVNIDKLYEIVKSQEEQFKKDDEAKWILERFEEYYKKHTQNLQKVNENNGQKQNTNTDKEISKPSKKV